MKGNKKKVSFSFYINFEYKKTPHRSAGLKSVIKLTTKPRGGRLTIYICPIINQTTKFPFFRKNSIDWEKV